MSVTLSAWESEKQSADSTDDGCDCTLNESASMPLLIATVETEDTSDACPYASQDSSTYQRGSANLKYENRENSCHYATSDNGQPIGFLQFICHNKNAFKKIIIQK
jgi:hypothetical protein